ncbi:MAG: glycosyltransferase family 4 protein [Hyphomicrobiales bacterium]|nr:glycosyltransferase family 4 protein [Hyphomicrobiales bacterium]
MTRFAFLIPGDIDAPTGGYAYARAVIEAWRASGVDASVVALPAGFPFPSPAELDETRAALAALDQPALIDGLAYGALPAEVVAAARAPIAALVHHPLAYETGLKTETAARLFASERQALALASRVIVTSRATAATLVADFGAALGKITVAEPGVTRGPRSQGQGDPPHIVSVGTISPRKGYDVLVAALAMIADLPWRCSIAGALDRYPETVGDIRARIDAAGLSARVRLLGALSAGGLDALYASADIFALASRYEGYGMAYAEAMARGLPIVACRGGATADTVPAAAGLLTEPDDASAFAAALRALLTDADLRRRLAQGAEAHGNTLPRWPDTARKIFNVMTELGS